MTDHYSDYFGVLIEEDCPMDLSYSSVNYRPPRKRRKLIEEFEALSLEDGEEAFSPEIPVIHDGNYLKSQYDSKRSPNGRRKRFAKENEKCSMDDFSEIKQYLWENEDPHHSDKRKSKQHKKRIEKNEHKEQSIATWDQVGIEKTVLRFITKSRDCWPKLYDKLVEIYEDSINSSIYWSLDFILAKDSELSSIANINSSKQLVDKFIKKVNQCAIEANSKFAEEVMMKMLKNLEKDFEMESEDTYAVNPYYQVNPLAITDYQQYHYIEPASNCLVEEVD